MLVDRLPSNPVARRSQLAKSYAWPETRPVVLLLRYSMEPRGAPSKLSRDPSSEPQAAAVTDPGRYDSAGPRGAHSSISAGTRPRLGTPAPNSAVPLVS